MKYQKKKGIGTLALVAIAITIIVIATTLLAPFVLRINIINEVELEYKYNNADLALLTLLSDRDVYEKLSLYLSGLSTLHPKFDRDSVIPMLKEKLDKIVESQCYSLSTPREVLISPDPGCKPEYTAKTSIVLPYYPELTLIAHSKPALQEFKKIPGVMLGVVADRAYFMMEQGYSWKDSVSGTEYSNVYELFHDKGIDWTRTMLFWNETEGEYNLDYVTKTLHSVNDAGLNILVVLGLSDGWGALDKQPGPTCVNFNEKTVLSRYCKTGLEATCPEDFDPDEPCIRYDSLSWEEKKSIIEEYSRNVAKHFNDNGLNVKVYEIGNEIDHGIAGIEDKKPDDPSHDINWYKNNIWPYEAKIINSAIKGIKDSDPDAKIQIHIFEWLDDNWIYEFFKFMLDRGVDIDYAAVSYYPTLPGVEPEKQKISWFLDNIDKVHQKLLGDGYNVKFVIAEFSYPSSQDLPHEFNWDNPVEGYPLTPEGQANWLHDFYDVIYTDDNIAGSFWLWPEAADGYWTNFCAVFYDPVTPVPELILVID